MMTRSLAVELARHQINVNAVAPGAIQTPGARRRAAQQCWQAATLPGANRSGVYATNSVGPARRSR